MKFVAEYYSPRAKKRWCLSLYDNVGHHSLGKQVKPVGEQRTLDNMGLAMLMNMFGGLGIGSPAVPVRSDVPPEELYATQLSQLQEMGFFDTRENIQALIATAGNVHAAVERLLGNPSH
ncbi:unnamed protein product [Camellia sinensis]